MNGVVNGAHIHKGSIGTNGPVVATLNVGGAFAVLQHLLQVVAAVVI